jgi:hypothetical protein
MLSVIWEMDNYMLLIWWLRSAVLILNTSWVMSWHRRLRKFCPGGEFHIFVNYNFTWITAESTFQRPLSNFSLGTILDVRLTHLIVLILHHRTSGFSIMWSDRGFQPLGREGAMGFRKQWKLLSWVNPSFRKIFLDSPSRALAPLLINRHGVIIHTLAFW